MNVVWSQEARSNVRSIGDYVGQHDPIAAQQVVAAIDRLVHRLRGYPKIGRRRDLPTRGAVEPRYRYVVRYALVPNEDRPDTLIVLSVWHPKRQR